MSTTTAATTIAIVPKQMVKTFKGDICGWEIYIFEHIIQIIPPFHNGLQIRMPYNAEGYPQFNEIMDFETGICNGIFANSFYTFDTIVNTRTENCELILYQNQNMIPLIHIYSAPVQVGEALHSLGNGHIPPHKPIGMCLADLHQPVESGYSSGEAEFSDTEY